MGSRTWHRGPPPHEGWWESTARAVPGVEGVWRWWNGEYWSDFVHPAYTYSSSDAAVIANTTRCRMPQQAIRWTDYWPKDAAVPRIDPRDSRRGAAFINECLRRVRGTPRNQWNRIIAAVKSEMS
mgnify:CR=1 FL=1